MHGLYLSIRGLTPYTESMTPQSWKELIMHSWFVMLTVHRWKQSETGQIQPGDNTTDHHRVNPSDKHTYHNQGRSDGGGVYRYIYPSPPNQSTLKKCLCGCFVSLTQDKMKLRWLVNIYTHPNQIPGYATDHNKQYMIWHINEVPLLLGYGHQSPAPETTYLEKPRSAAQFDSCQGTVQKSQNCWKENCVREKFTFNPNTCV